MKTCIINSALAVAFFSFVSASAYAGGGEVLPPNANPSHYSLEDMAEELALFSLSGNLPKFYPDTPFQILYVDYSPESTGTFHVRTGTMFFLPIAYDVEDDRDPGVPSNGRTLFFGRDFYGGHDLEIKVDGKRTRLNSSYAAGPVGVPKGLPAYGSHSIFFQVGAFLTPLSKGTHTVSYRIVFDGDALGGDQIIFEETYTVIVH